MNSQFGWGSLAAGTAFLLLALEWATAKPPAWLWRAHVDEEACAVYRGVFDDVRTRYWPIFWSGTVAWQPIFRDRARNLNDYAPNSFRPHYNGKASTQAADFAVNTSAFFPALRTQPSLFIRDCFARREGPSFHFGPGGTLAAIAQGQDAKFWRLSPVGFSADKRQALVYAEGSCGALCGVGLFFLFEKRADAWLLKGTALAWIS